MYCVAAAIVFIIIISFVIICRADIEPFSELNAKPFSSTKRVTVAKLFSQTELKGKKTDLMSGQKTTLYDARLRQWIIRSSSTVPEMVFRVTCDGLSNVLYLKSPGQLDNLPAALGGLPAIKNYTAIFNNGTDVYLECISVTQAEQESARLYDSCIENADPAHCTSEYSTV